MVSTGTGRVCTYYKKTISKVENGFMDEVGIKKVEILLDLLGMEFSLRPKGRPKTLEELQNAR